jgi:hypothetical protein
MTGGRLACRARGRQLHRLLRADARIDWAVDGRATVEIDLDESGARKTPPYTGNRGLVRFITGSSWQVMCRFQPHPERFACS